MRKGNYLPANHMNKFSPCLIDGNVLPSEEESQGNTRSWSLTHVVVMLADHRAEGKSRLSDGPNKDTKSNIFYYLGDDDERERVPGTGGK